MTYHMYQFSDKTNNFEFMGPNLPKNKFWARNFKNLSPDLESTFLRYFMHQFPNKTGSFEFLDPNFPKNGFRGQNFKNLSLDSESASLRYTMCTNFQTKRTTLNFWAQISPKIDFGVKISKI